MRNIEPFYDRLSSCSKHHHTAGGGADNDGAVSRSGAVMKTSGIIKKENTYCRNRSCSKVQSGFITIRKRRQDNKGRGKR